MSANYKSRRISHPLLLLAATLALLAVPLGLGQAQAVQRCFPETGFCIAGRIRSFWEGNGGLPVFGYPTTPQREELIEGRPYQVQWFERNRLELHPENQAPYDVLLGRLGAARLEQQGRDWMGFPTSTPAAGCRFFVETRHNACGAILAAWRKNGLEFDGRAGKSEAENLALFGLPLGDPQVETLEGKPYTVQWFERARFELHPENQPPYDVLLGLLGNETRAAAATPAPYPPPATPTSTPQIVNPYPSPRED
jgi:polysaccharide biosynthesis protein PslG